MSILKMVMLAFVPALCASFIGVKIKNFASEKFFRTAVLVVIMTVTIIGMVQVIFFSKPH